jgi:uncharacterized cupredoxin-like copper-binding protein
MPVTPSIRRPCAVALGLACFGLAACGGSDKSSSSSSSSGGGSKTSASSSGGSASGGAETKLALTATEGGGKFGFSKKTATAKAGTVTLTLDNPSSDQAPHAIAVEGAGVDKDGKPTPPGGTSTVTAKLKPGKYEFYCPVDGHRQAGMEGTLTVK